jgi:hypothetical protein
MLTVDVALYGPIERILGNVDDTTLFERYLEQLADSQYIAGIHYVGSNDIPDKYKCFFDTVVSTNNRNIFDDVRENFQTVTNYNFGYHILNLKFCHQVANTAKIIVHRIDIIPRDIDEILRQYQQSKKTYLIDSARNHTKLIPFYLSDFFYVGPKVEIDLTNLQGSSERKRVLLLNPFNKLTAGYFNRSHMYAEYIIWRTFFLTKLAKQTKESGQHNVVDVLKFWIACKDIEFISRSQSFFVAGKLKDTTHETWGHNIHFSSVFYSLLLFSSRSISILANKYRSR